MQNNSIVAMVVSSKQIAKPVLKQFILLHNVQK